MLRALLEQGLGTLALALALALTLTRCVLRTLLEQGLHARVRGLRQLDHLGT